MHQRKERKNVEEPAACTLARGLQYFVIDQKQGGGKDNASVEVASAPINT